MIDHPVSPLHGFARLLIAALAAVVLLWAWVAQDTASLGGRDLTDAPPRPGGYFRTLPAGVWADLPDDQTCAAQVHQSVWEPRPDNDVPNHHRPDPDAVLAAFAARPRVTAGAYDPRWDSWLLPRVTGHHTGTTDESIQWAACKWGLADDLLRAIAFRESGWFQYEVYSSGRCVPQHGCGDMVLTPDPESETYCGHLSAAGYDYEADYGRGVCPRTFSIVGVKSWQAPAWGRMPANQNGTFPFSRDSTAFALDYLGAFLRGCDEGWVWWLRNGTGHYTQGRIWGCVGVWYAGEWQSGEARRYQGLVHQTVVERPWLDPEFADQRPPCTADFGCPQGPPQLSGPTAPR